MAGVKVNLGFAKAIISYFGMFSITIELMLFFPKAFFTGNVLHAIIMIFPSCRDTPSFPTLNI
jgi:hypothetical protein